MSIERFPFVGANRQGHIIILMCWFLISDSTHDCLYRLPSIYHLRQSSSFSVSFNAYSLCQRHALETVPSISYPSIDILYSKDV